MLNENEKLTLLNFKVNKTFSRIKNFYTDFIEALYSLFCFMLDDPIENFWFECISILLGYFQLLIYIIDETVSLTFLLIYENSFGQYGTKI